MGIEGSDTVVGALASVEDKAVEVKTGVDALGAAGKTAGDGIASGAKPAAAALTEVEAAEVKLEAALKRLENANGPRALTKASRDATLAMMEYRDTATGAGVATDVMGAKVDGAKTQLVGAAGKVTLMKEEMAAMTSRGQFAAEGFESLGNKLGSVDGVLQLVKKNFGETGKSLAEFGMGAMAVAAGLMLADKAAQGVVTGAKAVGDAYVDMVRRQTDSINASVLAVNAQKAMAAGLKDVNGNLITTVGQYASYIAETQHGAQVTDQFAKSANFKVPESLNDLAKQAQNYGTLASNAYEDAKKAALASGASMVEANKAGEVAVTRLALANKSSLDSIAAGYRETGTSVDVSIQAGLTAIEKWDKAEKVRQATVADSKKGLDSLIDTMSKSWEADQKAAAAVEKWLAESTKRKLSDKDVQDGLEKIAAASGKTVDGLLAIVTGATAEKNAIDASRKSGDDFAGGLDKIRLAAKTLVERQDEAKTSITALVAASQAGKISSEGFAIGLGQIEKATGLTSTEILALVKTLRDEKDAKDKAAKATADGTVSAGEFTRAIQTEKEALAAATASGAESAKAFNEWKKSVDFARQSAGDTATGVEELKAKMAAAAAVAGNSADYEKWTRAVLDMRKAAEDAMGTVEQLGGVLQKTATAAQTATGNLNGLASAAGQCNDALGQGIGVQGQATVMMLQVTKATAEETQAFKDQLAAIGALTDATSKMLDVATGWKDYVITLTENYKSGTSSLLVYIQSLNDFAMQLRTMYAGATGDAKAALQEMIDMIGKLVATAGSTPQNTDTSPTGVLNNLFNKPK
jgi:hypothetical protein